MRLWSNLPQMDAGPGLRWATRGRRDTIDKPKAGRELVMQPAVYTALCACARAGWPIKASRHSMKPIRSLMFPRGSRYVRERPIMRVLRVHVHRECACARIQSVSLTSSPPTYNWILMLPINCTAVLAVYNLNTTTQHARARARCRCKN